MAMDAKDSRAEAALTERSNDGGAKFALQYDRSKSHDVGSSAFKGDTAGVRPCAVIGPDRVVPPSRDGPKKAPAEPWLAPDPVYRRLPDYPYKMPDHQDPTRNISPRQTFQENMQRIIMPPGYNSTKLHEDSPFASKNTKLNVPSEVKYCEVPYNINQVGSDQKHIRNTDHSASNVNPMLMRGVPHGWPTSSVHIRPLRTYGAPEVLPYADYANCTGPRPVLTRTHEEPLYPDPYYHESNIRFKPYPNIKERYPQSRYEYLGNYPSPYHPPNPYAHKYELPKTMPPHSYPGYPQVPKYTERIPEPLMDGYQRTLNQQGNYGVPMRNPVIHSSYRPVSGNHMQSKMNSYPPDGQHKPVPNKLPYDPTSKMYLDYETRSKVLPMPDNYYLNEVPRPYHPKNTIVVPNFASSNMHGVNAHPYYIKENMSLKNYEYPRYKNMDPNMINHSLTKLPAQFSPSTLAISPADSNASNETALTHGTSQEDCGYVSQSSVTSVRSIESLNRIPMDPYGRYDYRYGPIVRASPPTKPDPSSNQGSKSKKDIRQFISSWSEGDDENAENSAKRDGVKNVTDDKHAFNKQYESVNNQEQLYVLGLVNVPSEELSKYEHIQKVSKLPENIKGYNSLELLNQFEEAIESSNMASVKPPTPRTIQMPLKSVPHKHEPIPRPLSPLDVEAKISQSVIHKEVGCNFEIKPCSPKMLNVEVATPMQMLNERVIEKVANPHNVKSQSILQAVDENLDHTLGKQTMKCPIPNTTSSCKMINSQHLPNSPTIDHLKTSYTLHDLESNSGVCLASLPRLDTDIELNFPEVNQQFINANKTDSVITASFPKDLPTLDIERSAMATECDINYQYSPKTGTETDFSRLSKYRKLKRCVPDENDTASAKVQATRVDSVIIKNPDNTRSLEETNDNSGNGFKDDLQEFAMNLVSQTKHTKLQHDVDKMFDPSTNTDSYDDVKNKLPDTLIHQSNNLVNKQFSVNEESSSNNVIRPQTEDCNMHKDISNRYLEKAALDIPMNLSPQARHSLIEIDEEIRYTDKGGKTPVLEDKHRFVGGNIHGKENNASEVKCISSGHLDKPDDVLMNLQNDTSDEQRCNTYEKPLTIPNTHSNHLTTGLGKKCDLQKNDQDLTVLHVDNQISNSPKMEIESSVSYTKNQTSYSPKMETEMNNLVSHANHISSSPKIETETDSSISRDKTGNLFSPKTDTETDNATSHDKNQNSYSAKIKTETYNSVPHIQNHTFHITTVDSAIEKTSFFEDQQVALNEEGKVNLTSTINQTLSENKEEPKTLSIGEINQKNTLLSSHGENDILLKPYHKNHDSISYFPKLKRKKFRGEATHRKRNYQNKPLDIDDHVLKTGEKLNVLSIPDKKEPAEQLTHEKAQDIPETIIENEKNKTQIDSMSLITEFNKVDTDTDTEFNKDMPTATATNNDVIENISQNIPDDINNSVPVSSSPIEDKSFETIFKTETKELQNDLFLDIDNDTKKCNENSDSATNLNPDKLVVLNKNHKVNASDITSDLIEPAEFLTQENTNINIEANKFNMIERSYQDKSQSHDIDTLVSSVIKEKALEESRKDHLMHTDQSVEQGAELNVNTSFENENINITTNMLKKECQSNNLEIIKSNNEDNLMSEFKHDTQNNISPYETRTKNVLVCHEFVHKELFSSRFQNLLFYNVNFDTCPNNSEYNVTHELPTKNNNSYDHVASSPKTDEVNVNIDNKVSSEENIRELDSADRIETRNLADMAEKCFNVNLGVEIFDHTTDENKISSAQKDEYNINENHIPNDTESTMPSSEYDIKSFDTNRINIVADNEHLELHNVNASADSPVSKPVEEMAKSWENDLEEYNVKCVSDTHYTNEDCIQKSVDKIDYKFSGLDIDYESVNFQNDDDENANTVVDDSGYKSPYQEMDDECAKNLENNNDDSDLQLINNVESNVCDTNIILIENSISVTPEHCDDYNKIVRSVEDEFDKKIESFVEHISARPRFALKRSLSDSALNTYDDDVDECPQKRCVFPKKRKKICDITKIDESHLLNIIQSSRRNSVSTLSNENFSFCILIDDHCIVSEENCDENDMQFENNFLNHSLKDPEVGEKNASPAYKLEDQNENTSDTYINKYDEEKIWVEDVGCEETIETEDIAENIVIGEPGSPKDLTDYESDDEDMDTLSNEDANHTSKVKHIYGDNMCTNDAQLVDALYKTPQMDVNKKLMDKESHVTEKANSKYYDSDSLEMLLAEPVYNIPRTAPEPNVNLKIEKNENLDIEQRSGADSMNKENIDSKCLEDPSPLVSDIKNIMTIDALPKEDDIESKNNIMAPPADNCDDAQDGTIHSCESSLDNVFSYVDKRKSPHKSSSSPEVSSTTSEEKNSSILLKISNFKGSRVSEVKNLSSHLEEHNSCKHTTNEYFKPDYGHGTTSKRPLLTKAAQKYIPPLRESIPDLKVKLALPQQSLLKLQKNKVAKDEPKYNTRNIYSDKNHIKLKKEIPKKIKPKFEDVLKNIDEAQFQMHKAKNKKSKKYIPKVVIKKSENGSHYASTCTKEAFNPDLTGRKWQPWVFIEKNKFIDNMALRNKTRAVFSHRKKSFVLAEKFCKYRSISTAKFVISQPKVNEFSAGNLKYTIKLKHR